MVRKNNKKNRKKAAFYRINKFNYEARENLTKECPSPKETPIEEKAVKRSPGNVWTES